MTTDRLIALYTSQTRLEVIFANAHDIEISHLSDLVRTQDEQREATLLETADSLVSAREHRHGSTASGAGWGNMGQCGRRGTCFC